MKFRRAVFVTFAGLFLFSCMPASLWAAEPGELIMLTIDKGLGILKEPSLQGEENIQERRKRLWDELSPIFNFEEMSKRALGRYWRKRSPVEQKEFVSLFTKVLKDTYIGQTDTYSGEKIVLLKEKQEDHYAKVQTNFITSTGQEIAVDYSMINNQGAWGIYDVVIEGVSLVKNYRSQFYGILSKSSYEQLVKKIKDKK